MKTGATPVYVDIDENFCTDPKDAKKKITSQTKAIIIQHTFGQAAQLDELLSFAKEHKIFTIEDCAHSFGTRHKGKLTGTFADIGILSFGSDKVLSCVRGGAAITADETLGKQLQAVQQRLPKLPLHIVAQHLLHYPFFFVGRAWYGLGVGKILLALAKKLHLTNRIIDPIEKRGEFPVYAPATFAPVFARLLLPQLAEVDEQNEQRREIAALYRAGLQNISGIILPPEDEESIYLRYTIRVSDPERIEKLAKAQGMYLGDWYRTVIAPKDCAPGISGYVSGSCPRAELYAPQSLNLPTDRHISEADAQHIISFLRTCLPTPSAQ